VSARRPITRAIALLGAVTALTLGAPAAGHAADDAAVVRLYSATFNGVGIVDLPADGQTRLPFVQVDSYNPAINDDECSAVIAVGVEGPEVVRCSFFYKGSFVPNDVWYCTGEAVSTGTFVVFLPSGAQIYEFRNMRAVIDEASVHAVGTQYVDMGTGAIGTGYAQFDFGGTKCDKRVPNVGRVLY